MKKKFFILSSLIFAFLFFTSTMVFAANDTMNAIGDGARNVVNGAENLVTKGVDATKNTVNDVSKGIGDTMNSEKNATQNTTQNATRNNSNNYSTQRTATRTTANNGMFAGMNAMTWSWIIMGILGIAIVALVWAYGMQYDKEHKEEHSNINE